MAAPWNLARPDWRERIKAGLSLLPELPDLDKGEAARAVAIFNKLRVPDVVGQPPLSEAAGDWFREIVGAVHGSIDTTTRQRMIREVFLLAPKKSAKTTLGAAFMETSHILNERPRAEFLLIAPTLAVADLAYSQVVGMIEADEDKFLPQRMHVQQNFRKVTDRRTKASLQVKAFDPSILTGIKPAGVLVDELHEIARASDAQRIIGQIRGGLIANPEAFLVFITTQSDQPPRGAFRTELMNARAMRDGEAKGSTLSVLYEFPEDIALDKAIPPAWQDPKNWPMVTPNRGRSITIPRLEEDFERAKISGQDEIVRWASQHLNIEIGLALRTDRWAGADFWQGQAESTLTLDELLTRSDVVAIGGDGGGLDDLLGFAVMGRDKKTRQLLLWCRAWAHTSVLERRKGEVSVFRDFEKAGDLRIIERLGDDLEELAALAKKVKDTGKLFRVGLDPAGVGGIVEALEQVGITGDMVVGISQGWKLTGAIKTMERALADGSMVHAGQSLMAWCVGNAKVEPRGNAIIITKQAAGSAKIDPLMAAFNAITLMGMNPQPRGSARITLLD